LDVRSKECIENFNGETSWKTNGEKVGQMDLSEVGSEDRL